MSEPRPQDPVSQLFAQNLAVLREVSGTSATQAAELRLLRREVEALKASEERATAAQEARAEILRGVRDALLSRWLPWVLGALLGGSTVRGCDIVEQRAQGAAVEAPHATP